MGNRQRVHQRRPEARVGRSLWFVTHRVPGKRRRRGRRSEGGVLDVRAGGRVRATPRGGGESHRDGKSERDAGATSRGAGASGRIR